MKAFLIDPYLKEITEVNYSGEYTQIYTFIHADCFATAVFNKHGDTFFVDDEGLFREDKHFFEHHGYGQPLAGYALVLGANTAGESVEPTITLEELNKDLKWYSEYTVGFSGAFI